MKVVQPNMNEIIGTKEVIEAIDNLAAAVKKLKSLRVIRSQKWTADYGEWLVTKLFDGELSKSINQEGWDVKIAGRKVQVRTSFIPQRGSEYTRCYLDREFDELIVVGLTDNMRIGKMFRITKKDLEPIIRNGSEPRVNWTDLLSYSVDMCAYASSHDMEEFLAQPVNVRRPP